MARPPGSENKGKRWRAAFARLYDASPEKLDELALVAHNAALGADMQAMAFIRDTTDGKPAQAMIGGDDDEPAIKADVTIRRVIVEPDGH